MAGRSLRASPPTFDDGGDDNVTTSASDVALVRFDITAIAAGTSVLASGAAAVQRWVDSPASNHGFALVVSPGGSHVSFISREGGASAAALLVITVP